MKNIVFIYQQKTCFSAKTTSILSHFRWQPIIVKYFDKSTVYSCSESVGVNIKMGAKNRIALFRSMRPAYKVEVSISMFIDTSISTEPMDYDVTNGLWRHKWTMTSPFSSANTGTTPDLRGEGQTLWGILKSLGVFRKYQSKYHKLGD